MRATATLDQRVGAPMQVGDFLPLAIRLAGGVAELHGRGALHGDLRPATILIDDATGDVALASSPRTAPGLARMLAGSLPYMSPEQTGKMNRPVDSRSDLYSLGVVFYQLLAGRLPFDAEDAVGWVHCHVARQPRPLDQAPSSPPRPLVDIVGKLLAKLPDHRYQSALGLRHDLERCLREWRERGAIAAFPLGERDASEEFRPPMKLYGRDAEAAALGDAFERAAETGTPELVLVSGYAGIGKSALVRELLRPVVRRRGRFIAGKFEQYKRDIPYFAITQALRALALDLVAEGEPRLGRWRQRLAQALGSYGKLIVDLVPQLGLIVGPQPPVPEVSLTEGETRLRLVFGRLFAACATAEHPLTLFVDDMQWADSASLALVAGLMAEGEPRHLLIIGAYRDNEVDPTHPLVRTLEPVRRSGARIRDIVLGPLSADDLDRLVADTVHASTAEAAPLAALLRDKTGGNPFFAIQFLTALYHKRAIWFDRDAYRWRWDVARIGAEGYTDNIAELMRGRLHTLPDETRVAPQLAACLGGTVDAATLAIACERDLGPALQPALDQHLLFESLHADRRGYRFPHDRVHEAAYALLPEPERARVHLEIGRRLLARATPEDLAERLFEVVHQLDCGAALIDAPEERERLAELHLAAGTRAQTSTAYASALRYFTAGAALLPADAWERRPALAFALELHRARCEFLTGALDAAQPRLAGLSHRAASTADLAAVATVQISIWSALGRYALAIEAMLDFLRRAGIAWPARPTDDDVRREHDRIWQQLGSRAIEDLVDLPPMTDPDLRATMDVLALAQTAAMVSDMKLHALLVCRLVNLSLEHGNSDPSCIGYTGLGMLLRPRFGNHVDGFRFGQVALDLVERRGLLRWKARVYLDFGILIRPWAKHLRESVELTRRCFDLAKEAGDLVYAAYACRCLPSLLLAVGEPLATVQSQAEAGLEFIRKAGFDALVEDDTVQLQTIRSLRGLTRELGALDDDAFSEERFEQHLEADPRLAITACWYWIRKLQARFMAGDHATAAATAARARRLLWTTPSFPEAAEHAFHAALAGAAYHDEAPEGERPRLCEEVAADHAQLAVWAEHNPDNFGSRAALAGAELARIRGDEGGAIRLYEAAIRAARTHGFINHEALAYELAARFYRGRGQDLTADAYLREAHARYLRWGADGKVRQLRRDHPDLELPTTGPASPAQLDRLSVVKASQTISSVIDKDLLPGTLLRFVLEEGGARRVALISLRDGELAIAAEVRVDEATAPVAGARVPRSLLAYVQQTQELVLLDAEADAGPFAGDPYFVEARPRSVLCLPVRLRAEAAALLYLENELVPGAFTPERLLALELLAAQAAISLENARLLDELRRALYLREEFLRIASHELRTPLASLRLTAQALLRAGEQKRAVPPEFAERSLRRMLGNTIRLEQLTAELLDVTRIEQGRLELDRSEIALDAVVRDAVGHLEPDLAAAGSLAAIECAAPVYGAWDPLRLGQVVTNLVSNAMKFGAGKPIEIRIERIGDAARLTVADHGIGIDPARLPYVFDRFERAVPSSSYGGLGLGLYIARSIVVSHGGAITVESQPGAGATFTVTLPCEAPARPRPAAEQA